MSEVEETEQVGGRDHLGAETSVFGASLFPLSVCCEEERQL